VSEQLDKVVEAMVWSDGSGGFNASTETCYGYRRCLLVPIPAIQEESKHNDQDARCGFAHEALRMMGIKVDVLNGSPFLRCTAEPPYTPPDVKLPKGWTWAGQCREPQTGEMYWCHSNETAMLAMDCFPCGHVRHLIKQESK
jgi:hypothetical protein